MGSRPFLRFCWRTPSSQQLPLNGNNAYQRIQLNDIHDVFGVHVNVARAGKIGPLLYEFPIRREYLYPVVLPVCDEYAAIGVTPHPMRNVKLSGSSLAGFSP